MGINPTPISTSEAFDNDGFLIFSFTSSTDAGLRKHIIKFFDENPDIEIGSMIESWQYKEK